METVTSALETILCHMPQKYRKKVTSGECKLPRSIEEPIEQARRRVALENQTPGSLRGYDCPKCLNRGKFYSLVEDGPGAGEIRVRECSCMARRRTELFTEKSGLAELVKRYTLETWQCPEEWQAKLRRTVEEYVQKREGWLYISGRPGTGKTHICTALCALLLEQGLSTRYMLWRDVSVRAKAVVNDEEAYQEIVRPLKKATVLYIDDFFKTGKAAEPTVGDVNLAFEIINARYNDSRLLTIFSSERKIDDILDIDEGLGSRIAQRVERRYYDLSGEDKENWRLKNLRS